VTVMAGDFLDSNVLVYAFTSDPRAVAAQGLLERGCATSVQGLNEFANVARRKLGMNWEEIREALQEPVTQIIDAVKRTLEMAEPELAADLVENGITMAGGSSLLRGLTTVISNATGLDVRLAEDPLTCVARGTSVYLENLELWKETMESDADEG